MSAGVWRVQAAALCPSTPEELLAGRSPAEVLRVLGEEGLNATLGHLAQIAPRTPVGDLRLPSAEQLRSSLRRTLGEDTRGPPSR
jgi:hypothetical protein